MIGIFGIGNTNGVTGTGGSGGKVLTDRDAVKDGVKSKAEQSDPNDVFAVIDAVNDGVNICSVGKLEFMLGAADSDGDISNIEGFGVDSETTDSAIISQGVDSLISSAE